jgi:hypothetical protein
MDAAGAAMDAAGAAQEDAFEAAAQAAKDAASAAGRTFQAAMISWIVADANCTLAKNDTAGIDARAVVDHWDATLGVLRSNTREEPWWSKLRGSNGQRWTVVRCGLSLLYIRSGPWINAKIVGFLPHVARCIQTGPPRVIVHQDSIGATLLLKIPIDKPTGWITVASRGIENYDYLVMADEGSNSGPTELVEEVEREDMACERNGLPWQRTVLESVGQLIRLHPLRLIGGLSGDDDLLVPFFAAPAARAARAATKRKADQFCVPQVFVVRAPPHKTSRLMRPVAQLLPFGLPPTGSGAANPLPALRGLANRVPAQRLTATSCHHGALAPPPPPKPRPAFPPKPLSVFPPEFLSSVLCPKCNL